MNRDDVDRWGYRGSAWRPQVPVDTVNESRKRSLVLGAHGPVDVFDPGAAATATLSSSRPRERPTRRGGVNGIAVGIGPEAVVIQSERPLLTVSSAPVGGGLARVRAVINLHVRKNDPCLDPAAMMTAFARRAGVPAPYVGLLTGAWTEAAQQGTAARYGIEVLAVATVGLSNRMAAGLLAGAVPGRPSTINAVVVVDAEADPAALVNAVITVTEVKARLLGEMAVRDGRGQPVTGTSTDAVVVAATGTGPRARFGGPASELGWVVARAAGRALEAGIRHWLESNP